jgi:hypothetical protein
MKRVYLKLPIIVFALCAAVICCGVCSAANDPFARFIKPVTNPVYFDEAQNISYVHLVNAYQDLPKRISTKLGRVPLDGHLNLTANQGNVCIQ